MQKQTALGIVLGTVLFVGLSGGAFFLLESQKSETSSTTKPAVDIPLDSAKSAVGNTQTGSGLRVQGDSTSSNKASERLSPEEFKEYEQYANAQSTQIQDYEAGTGQEASTGDTVAVVYMGWLTDGTLFDKSTTDEQNKLKPITFTIGSGQIIPGWEQGILGMKEGGKRRLIVPSQFGYGPNGQGPIPPNAMLIFDVQLVQVQKPQAQPAPTAP